MKLDSGLFKILNKIDASYRSLKGIFIVTAFLLLIPLVAMQFTDEVNWSLFDFIVAGLLLSGTGLAYKFLAGKGKNYTFKIASGISIATALLMVWSNLAIGIIGSEDNPANLMYIGVLAVGIIGALIVRLRSGGMFIVLITTALSQVLLVAIVLTTGFGYSGKLREILIINGFFILLWISAALLFRNSEKKQQTA